MWKGAQRRTEGLREVTRDRPGRPDPGQSRHILEGEPASPSPMADDPDVMPVSGGGARVWNGVDRPAAISDSSQSFQSHSSDDPGNQRHPITLSGTPGVDQVWITVHGGETPTRDSQIGKRVVSNRSDAFSPHCAAFYRHGATRVDTRRHGATRDLTRDFRAGYAGLGGGAA